MPAMGKYCKAYLASAVRAYPQWTENLQNLRHPEAVDSRREPPAKRIVLKDDDIVYVQENYCVTDDCYKDEFIIFDNVTDDWRRFCTEQLGFNVPDETAGTEISGVQEIPKAAVGRSG